jgi:hypothetical protein
MYIFRKIKSKTLLLTRAGRIPIVVRKFEHYSNWVVCPFCVRVSVKSKFLAVVPPAGTVWSPESRQVEACPRHSLSSFFSVLSLLVWFSSWPRSPSEKIALKRRGLPCKCGLYNGTIHESFQVHEASACLSGQSGGGLLGDQCS